MICIFVISLSNLETVGGDLAVDTPVVDNKSDPFIESYRTNQPINRQANQPTNQPTGRQTNQPTDGNEDI